MSKADPAEPHIHQSAFSEPLFRRYFPSSCCSTLGSWLVRFLLGWSAWEATHSPLWVGVVAAVSLFPTFILSPVFGILSDRINPRNGLIVTVLAQALIACVAGTVDFLGVFTLPWLVGLAFVLGTVTSAHTPIRLALIPRLVPRGALPSAVGFSAIIFNISRILGPAAGAWLIAHYSTAIAFYAAMAMFFCSLLLLSTVKGLQKLEQRDPSSLLEEFQAGFRYAREHRGIRLVFGFTLINGLLGRTVLELLPALSGVLLNGDARTLAALTATAGVGSIIGGLVVSRQSGNERRLLQMVVACLLLGAICLLPIHWIQSLTALGAIVMCLSMITTMVGTGSQVLTQLLVADAFRGRVLSLWTVLAMGAPSIGALVMGALADSLGFPIVLTGFAVLALIAVAALWAADS